MVTALIGLPGVGKSLILSYIAHLYTVGKSPNNCKLCVSSQKNMIDYILILSLKGLINSTLINLVLLTIITLLCCVMKFNCLLIRNFKQFGDNFYILVQQPSQRPP